MVPEICPDESKSARSPLAPHPSRAEKGEPDGLGTHFDGQAPFKQFLFFKLMDHLEKGGVKLPRKKRGGKIRNPGQFVWREGEVEIFYELFIRTNSLFRGEAYDLFLKTESVSMQQGILAISDENKEGENEKETIWSISMK